MEQLAHIQKFNNPQIFIKHLTLFMLQTKIPGWISMLADGLNNRYTVLKIEYLHV